MSERLTVTVSDGLYDLVEGISRYSHQTDEVPALSKSKVFRFLARDGAQHYVDGDLDLVGTETNEIEKDVLLDLVPKHVRARFLRDEIKDENWLAYMRGGFEDRVRDRLGDVFASDFTTEEAAEVAEGFRQEARLYWEVLDDEPETLEEKLAFVDERLEQYRERRETTTWDPDEEWLSGFGGVEDGETQEAVADVEDEIRALAEDRLGENKGRDEVVDALDLVYGDVPRGAIEEIVDEARREVVIEAQQRKHGDLDELPDGAEIVDGAVSNGSPQEVAKANGNVMELEGETHE